MDFWSDWTWRKTDTVCTIAQNNNNENKKIKNIKITFWSFFWENNALKNRELLHEIQNNNKKYKKITSLENLFISYDMYLFNINVSLH